ncbi:MAG: DUF3368 domain-containing protein [Pyrinomonadaceae bacterium]
MKEAAIVDSTCLIGLERINLLDVLPALFDPVLIPPAVAREFGTSISWLRIKAPTNHALLSALKLLLDEGEAEAIALASEYGYKLVLDDRQARAVAQNLGLPLIGTVGVLVKAKREGIIPALKSVLDEMEANGFYLRSALKEEALRLVGE